MVEFGGSFLEVSEAVKSKFALVDPSPYPAPSAIYISPNDEPIHLSPIAAPNEPPVIVIETALTRQAGTIKRATKSTYYRNYLVRVKVIMDTHADRRNVLPDHVAEQIGQAWYQATEVVMLPDPHLNNTVWYWGNSNEVRNDAQEDISLYIGSIDHYDEVAKKLRLVWGADIYFSVTTKHSYEVSF